MKIATRLLWLFLLLAVLPLALFSYLNLWQDAATLRSTKMSEMSNLADKKIVQIKSYLEERELEVRIRARGPQVIEGMIKLPKLYAQGKDSAAYLKEDAWLHQYFDRYVKEYELFYDAFLISPQGEIIFSQKHEADFASNLLSGAYRESQLAQVFRTVTMTLEPVISGYEFYPPTQSAALFIAAPIMIDGKFKGVFAVQLDNERLVRVASDATGLGVTGEAVFAQRDVKGVLFSMPLKYHADAAMKLRRSLQEISVTPMFAALSGNANMGMSRDYRNQEVAAAWRYLPEVGWGMVVKIDAEEALATVAQQRMLLLGGLFGLLLVITYVAYFFGRTISEPIRKLVITANEVAAGDFNQRVDESAAGELGYFARAFNRMSENLQGLYASLELRTRELHRSNEQLQQEIVERELVQQEVLFNALRIETLLNSVAEGIYGVDLQGNCTFINAAGLQLLGYAAESELVGQHVHELIHHTRADGTHYPSDECRLDRCLQSTESIHVEDEVFWRKDGTSFPVDYWSRPTLQNGAVGAVVTFMDITERQRVEDNLRIAAATFETHEGIMITDDQANIIRVNKAFQAITGFSAEDVLGQNPRLLRSGRQSEEFYEQMWSQLLEQGTWSGEIWDRRKNGEIYPKWMTLSAVKDAGGKTTEYVAIFSDITERKRAEDEIRNLAFYDALTGLPNRRSLLDRFKLALSVSARNHHCGAILLLDMDKFKTLNDTLGHDYGDLLLIEVAHRIQTCVRETDTVARLGGDEFVVLLEEVSANMQDASQRVSLVAEKIRASLSAPYRLKNSDYHSSPSIGVSMYYGNSEAVDVLMKHADLAMYQAKDSGRNAVRFFDPLMQQTVDARAKMEADLRGALPKQQLQLYYQIQVDGELRPIGAEALIRWVHPERGMVSPANFIPIAEESSLILDIGHWVIETACHQLAEWACDEQRRYFILAINVSAQQFRVHDFVERLMEVIARYDIHPERLKLELTESVVLDDVANVVAKMHALKALGVRLSLDDFGTGYSSLAYLKQLPLDQIKIDQSFVRDVTSDPNDAVMVKTIIDMAKNFRLNVIAEGVETEAQLAFLQHNDCMAYQGYLFSKPVPVAEFEALALRMNG